MFLCWLRCFLFNLQRVSRAALRCGIKEVSREIVGSLVCLKVICSAPWLEGSLLAAYGVFSPNQGAQNSITVLSFTSYMEGHFRTDTSFVKEHRIIVVA